MDDARRGRDLVGGALLRPQALAAAMLALLALLAGCTSSGGGAASSSAATSPSGSAPSSVTGSVAPSTTASGSATATPSQRDVHQQLTDFRVADVTFVGAQAWALGSADCLSGTSPSGSHTCDAIEYSADNGSTWRSAPAPHANILSTSQSGCASPCVAHLRFASPTVGYAFSGAGQESSGDGSLFLTTDGGRTWRQQTGGADALESLDGNVIRVTDRGGCPPGCRYVVQTAPLGSTAWHTVTLPGSQSLGAGVTLARTGSHAYLQSYGNPAGGGNDETSVLWTSADDGARWTNRGEVCPQGRAEVDSTALTTAPSGAVVVVCTARSAGRGSFVVVSTDGGAHFHAASKTALGAAPVLSVGAGSASLVLVSSDETYRSTDGGGHFARLSADAGSAPGQLAYLGFASSSLVHGIALDRRSVWSSPDGGQTWSQHRFS